MISDTVKSWLRRGAMSGWMLILFSQVAVAGPEHTTANYVDEPHVKIVAPANGYQTNEPGVSVTIEYDNILTLTLNGNPIAINAGAHSVTVTYFLAEGMNVLKAVGKAKWSQSTDSIQAVLDTHPPVLNLHPTLDQRKATTEIPYAFDAQINEQDFTANEYQFKIDGAIKQAYSASPIFHFIPQPTESGNKTLTVQARDVGGEASQDIGIYIYRNPS